MRMSRVKDCDAKDCVYNKDNKCHTLAINIGDLDPVCDTYMKDSRKQSSGNREGAGIGSCKVRSCCHNSHLECAAEGGVHMHLSPEGHVDCKTYKAK